MNFRFFLKYFVDHGPFKKTEQLEHHLLTIQRRRCLGSAAVALKDPVFLKSLYKTLGAWGIGKRASKLRPFQAFVSALNASEKEICELDGVRLDQTNMNIELIENKIWNLISTIEIVENKAKLVPCSKLLHHVLPELIVPIDREYTQVFFGWQNPTFQKKQAFCFRQAYREFQRISIAVNPSQYVGTGWNSSMTKVIDNAIVGLVQYKKAKLEAEELV